MFNSPNAVHFKSFHNGRSLFFSSVFCVGDYSRTEINLFMLSKNEFFPYLERHCIRTRHRAHCTGLDRFLDISIFFSIFSFVKSFLCEPGKQSNVFFSLVSSWLQLTACCLCVACIENIFFLDFQSFKLTNIWWQKQ